MIKYRTIINLLELELAASCGKLEIVFVKARCIKSNVHDVGYEETIGYVRWNKDEPHYSLTELCYEPNKFHKAYPDWEYYFRVPFEGDTDET